VWRALFGARDDELAVIGQRGRATLAADVPTFVRSVRNSAANFGQIAITATVFGAARCVIYPESRRRRGSNAHRRPE